jgi:protoheme ferro-lyase
MGYILYWPFFERMIIMVDKNKKKESAKKYRNLWTMNPITRIVESRKKYKRQKDRKNKRLYED